VPSGAKLTIDVWDQDSLNSDYVGKAVIRVAELPPNAPPLARWPALPRGEVCVEVAYAPASTVCAPAAGPVPPAPSQVDVLAFTWNVGNALPPGVEELRRHWLAPRGAGLIAVGSQECAFKPTPDGFRSSADFWFARLRAAVGDGGAYTLLSACSLGQMHLALFCARELLPHVSRVESQGEATGIAHVLGNKRPRGVLRRARHLRLLRLRAPGRAPGGGGAARE